MKAIFDGIPYQVITPPCADNDELAAQGKRLIVYHSPNGVQFIIADPGVLQAGWVIGIMED